MYLKKNKNNCECSKLVTNIFTKKQKKSLWEKNFFDWNVGVPIQRLLLFQLRCIHAGMVRQYKSILIL